MKHYLFTMAMSAVTFTTFAQPSDATVKSKATSDGSTFVEFVGTGKVHSNLTETWYIRVAVTKKATEHPGINYIAATEYKYKKSGSSWVFDRTYHWWNQYEGIPNPTEAEAVALVKSDLAKFLGGSYGDIVGELGEIKLAADPKWEWTTMQTVSFIMETSFDAKTSYTEVTSMTKQFEVKFYADEFKGPWKRFISSNHGEAVKHGTKVYSSNELDAMPTLRDADNERKTKEATSHLPQVEIPVFASEKALIFHTHNMLRTYTKDQMHAYLLGTMSSFLYAPNSKVILSERGQRLLDNILSEAYDGKGTYKDQYCEHPAVKHEQENMMELWNRAKDRKIRISVTLEDDQFKMSDLEAYVFKEDADIQRLATENQCGNPVSDETPVVVQKNDDTKTTTNEDVKTETKTENADVKAAQDKGKGKLNSLKTKVKIP